MITFLDACKGKYITIWVKQEPTLLPLSGELEIFDEEAVVIRTGHGYEIVPFANIMYVSIPKTVQFEADAEVFV